MAEEGVVRPANKRKDLNRKEQEEVAALAFEFWLERGFRNGSPEEDLFKAQQVIQAKAYSLRPLKPRLFLVK